MPKDDKPNLDLIQMVQKARMQNDAEAQPSNIAAVYWIEAKHPGATPPTARSGGWVLDTTVEHVDAQWQIIKAATKSGKLGYKSKVSTASRDGKHADSRTIIVKTADADALDDVNRMRAVLKEILPGKWRYERD